MTTSHRAACLMGYPVKHSRSPMLHGYWIKRYGIDGAYRAEEIRPEDFKDFITNLAARGYVGGNVTMPHKDAAFALSTPDDRPTPTSKGSSPRSMSQHPAGTSAAGKPWSLAQAVPDVPSSMGFSSAG
jgi:Shikimate dehydrogenase substrate binding domain